MAKGDMAKTTSKKAPRSGRKEPTKKTAKGKKPVKEKEYVQLKDREQILLRPDTYIGNPKFEESDQWVFDESTEEFDFRTVRFVPGLYKIYDEILVNALDWAVELLYQQSQLIDAGTVG